jgi:hypothetical protein
MQSLQRKYLVFVGKYQSSYVFSLDGRDKIQLLAGPSNYYDGQPLSVFRGVYGPGAQTRYPAEGIMIETDVIPTPLPKTAEELMEALCA